MPRALFLAFLVWFPASPPGAAPDSTVVPSAVRELPSSSKPVELAKILERARAAARSRKPRDRELKAQITRLRERASIASPRPERQRGTHSFGESKQPLVIIEGDAKAFVAKEGALSVARVLDGVLVVDGDVEVGFAYGAVIVATGAVSVAHAADSVIVGGAYVGVSHDRAGVLLSGGLLDVSHADASVLAGRDLRVTGVQEKLTCVNGETVALTCDRVRDLSLDLGAAPMLPGALFDRVAVTEARGDAPAHAWFRVDGGPERDAAQGAPVPGLDGWRLVLADYAFVLFRKGEELSGWRLEPRARTRLMVGTRNGEVHVLDRETLGKRQTWTLGGKERRPGHVWLFHAGQGRVLAASESGRALQVGEGSHPVSASAGEPIRQASLHGNSLVLQGRSLHFLWSSSSWGGEEPRLQTVPLARSDAEESGRPPRIGYLSRGGRMFLARRSEILRPEFSGKNVAFDRKDVGGDVHSFLAAPDESELLALTQGDDVTPPHVVFLAPDTLEIRRTLSLPKPGRVHDALLSRDGKRLIVALGERVECVHLASGEVIWESPARGGGHVTDAGGNVAILGHASPELRVLEIDRGAVEWTLALGVGDAPQLGHAFAWDTWTRQMALIDDAGKRVLLVRDGAVHASEPFDATPTDVVFVQR